MRRIVTKSELIHQIAEQCPTLRKLQIVQAVDLISDGIKEHLRARQKLEIREFGSFRTRHRRAKEGRNPKSGASIPVAEGQVPFYKCGKELKELLNPKTFPSTM